MNKLFKLNEHGTTVRTEIIAGTTTFLAMAYILAVNPSILGTVMNPNGVFVATALASAIATFIMGLWANYPIALSAGLGLNAYFAYTVCLSELSDVPNAFTIALTAVFVEGVIFIIMSFFKFREKLVNGIPKNLKYGITGGLGLFIAFIGMQNAHIIVSNESTILGLGSFLEADMALALIGVVITVVLVHFKVKGSVLIAIIATWILGMIAEKIGWRPVDVENGVYSVFPSALISFDMSGLKETAFKFNFAWAGKNIISFIAVVISFLYIDLFDTVGTVVGVADKAHLLNEKGELPRAERVLLSDAIGTTVGACLGTSTVTSFVESATGVGAGGRTGLTAVVTAIWFLIALVFSPIFLAIPSFATAPALIYVGMLMVSSVSKMDFEKDQAAAIGGYMALVMMPLAYSIATGIMFAILSYVLVKICIGKAKEVTPIMWVMFALFALRIVSLITNFM
ncbi:MAG: NCS2 family permease [Firmicutes bacterium]|nr:NCS2 family permease [Bacillota bacterium]